MPTAFRDRTEAGRLLADKLTGYAGRPNVLVLALPRGGVPVASEVARALGAPLDVFVVRKLGVPGHEELAWAPSPRAASVCSTTTWCRRCASPARSSRPSPPGSSANWSDASGPIAATARRPRCGAAR